MNAHWDRIRLALRTLRKQPVFSIVVVLSLALAIALNTTMYGVLDALVRPRTDIRRPGNLYWIRLYGGKGLVSSDESDAALREGARAIEAIAPINPLALRGTLEYGSNSQPRTIAGVGLEFFPLLDAGFAAGRPFTADDAQSPQSPIIINEQLAAALFPGQTNVLGERITMGDSTFTVIGVLTRYTKLPEFEADAFILTPAARAGPYSRIVRLRDGATRDGLQRQLDQIARRVALAHGLEPIDVAFRTKLVTDVEYHYRGFHYALIVAVIAILLVACANVANMQMARGVGRRRELALRSALGASRGRIIGHLLLEATLLATIGLGLGLVLTYWMSVSAHALIPPSVGTLIVEPQWSWRVFTSAIVAMVACLVIIGVAPAVAVSRVDPNELLKSGAGTGATRRQRRQYGYLVTVEIALALLLVSGAVALVRSTSRAADLIWGYDERPLASAALVHRTRAEDRRSVAEVMGEAVVRARRVGGVADAAVVLSRPVVGDSVTVSDSAIGVRAVAAPLGSYQLVTPSYLRTMGLTLLAGRDFTEGERDAPVAIIDEFTALSLWPTRNPVGAMIKMGAPSSDAPYVRVVGVFGYRGRFIRKRFEMAELNGQRVGRVLLLPTARDSVSGAGVNLASIVTVRAASGDAKDLPVALRRAGFSYANTYDVLNGTSRSRQTRAFVMALFVGFASMGLGLAAFGVYGVIAHSVAERRRELGVRIALGASSRDILHAVLRETIVIGLAGVAVGLLLTKYSVPMLGAFLLEDEMYNAPLFAAGALFLFIVAGSSALVPALRATRVDPTESLRSE